jgi:hypothetical protein
MSSDGKELRVDQQTYYAIRCATLIQEQRLWPDSEIADARHMLNVQFRREPTLEDLATSYGAEVVNAVAKHVITSRLAEVAQMAERMGHGSPCHLCGSPRTDTDPYYEFGLARILEEKTEWGTAGAALAMNLLTLPFGIAVGAGPGKSTRANIARCRLVLCHTCCKSRERFFSGLKISESDCAKHPSWNRLHNEGFDRFLDDRKLAQFR